MTGSAGDFKVDTDALKAVASSIQDLLDDIQGKHGYIAGNLTEFQKIASIAQAMAPYWGDNPDNVYAGAYGDEYTAIQTTYTTIVTQLSNLVTSAQSTAASYEAQEAAAKAAVAASGGG